MLSFSCVPGYFHGSKARFKRPHGVEVFINIEYLVFLKYKLWVLCLFQLGDWSYTLRYRGIKQMHVSPKLHLD